MNTRRQVALSTAIYIAIALPVLLFTFVMLGKIIPYLSFEPAINFLSTKSDKTLYNPVFRVGFYTHITTSFIVMAIGVIQFFPLIVRERPKLHRFLGKVYVVGILLFAAPSGLILARYANGGMPAQVGFSLQCLVWWFATYRAYDQIAQGKYLPHIRWMLRSYAVTLAAMSLRTEGYILQNYFETKPIETYITITWLSWVGNLLLAEILITFHLDKFLLKQYTSNSSGS